MLFRASMRQARRAPVRMILCFALMALVCAFLTLGLNLRASTEKNLEAIYDSYEVIAVPSFQGYVTRRGLPADMGDHAGYWPCAAEDYDLTPILNAAGVKSIDVRNRFGAYVHNEGFERGAAYSKPHAKGFEDVIRFVFNGTESVTLESIEHYDSEAMTTLPLTVTWSAAGYPVSHTYATSLPVAKHSGSAITLDPGKEYIATVNAGSYRLGDTTDKTKVYSLWLDISSHQKELYAYYDGGAHWESWRRDDLYEPIAEYSEDFWETEQGTWFAEAAECCYYDIRSINAVTTNDLSSVLPFYKGNLSVVEGRGFTADDYQNGNPVCIVSAELADINKWQVGDVIEFSFFENQYMYTRIHDDLFPQYNAQTEEFFDRGSYEIIGIYDGLLTVPDASEIEYNEEIGALWIDVYLPEKSVENAPSPKLHSYNTTIRLETLSGMEFLADMEDSGLTRKREQGYQVTFKLYDQGISAMADGLQQMSDISTLTVSLSAAASLLSVAVLAVFHLWRSKKEIACLRSLGLRKGQVLVVILAGLLAASALGCVVGAWCGHRISGQVAERILAAASEDLGDTTFTANTVGEEVWSKLDMYSFESVQPGQNAVLAALAVMAVMALFCTVLVWNESRKPPLLQLGRRE
ncbi:MAG: ABC transporter permease [Clostridia bacterium]|nr:ABC transporter permease [Clostridia bacterium]